MENSHHQHQQQFEKSDIEQSETPQQTEPHDIESQENNEEKTDKKFAFDRTFQEKIVHAMLHDKQWASQFNEVLDVEYFHHAHLKLIADHYLSYYKKYKEFPSNKILINMIKDELREGKDDELKDQVVQFLKRVKNNEELGDLPYVKEKALDFCRKSALQNALIKCAELVKSGQNYEKSIELVKDAVTAGNTNSPGIDLIDDVDARYSETFRKTIPTGIEELDQKKILNGGLGAGELGVVVAPTSVGKSHLMIHFGASAIRNKKNVVHFTFELNERAVGIRYDSHLLQINSLECFEHLNQIKQFYKENKDSLGKLDVKYYPTSTVTINTLRSYIEKLSRKRFVPDMIVIDYAGIMRSTEKYELLRMELKKIMQELRQFSSEMDVPVWTAIQSNKEGANQETIELTNMAEAYGQAHEADFVLGLNRPNEKKATGYGNINVAKNRAGIDGIKFPIHLDTGTSTLRVIDENEAAQADEQVKQEFEEMKMSIRDYQKKDQS